MLKQHIQKNTSTFCNYVSRDWVVSMGGKDVVRAPCSEKVNHLLLHTRDPFVNQVPVRLVDPLLNSFAFAIES